MMALKAFCHSIKYKFITKLYCSNRRLQQARAFNDFKCPALDFLYQSNKRSGSSVISPKWNYQNNFWKFSIVTFLATKESRDLSAKSGLICYQLMYLCTYMQKKKKKNLSGKCLISQIRTKYQRFVKEIDIRHTFCNYGKTY